MSKANGKFTVDGEDPTKALEQLVAHWKKEARKIQKALDAVKETKTATDVLCEHAHALAPKAYAPAPFKQPAKVKAGGSPQSAVALLSDTHIGADVKPNQTLGLGNYNFKIFLRRLNRLEQAIRSILHDHTATAVPELVLPILGDMLDGALTHAAECGQANTLFEQFYAGGHALAQFIRNLSALTPSTRIYSTVGNHTRWQNQKKMPTKNRYSNYDQFLYAYVSALLRDCPTVKWHLDAQPFATFDVQGFHFYCGHGDNLRGGDRIMGLPAHSIGRMVSTTTQLFTRAGMHTPDYFCFGHLHRPISVPHAKGEVIINGAFPGIDSYALNEYFNSSYPSQKFWLMHPKFGKTAHYDLRLDLGDKTPHAYQLPNAFTCL